jgi:hypothetical protein
MMLSLITPPSSVGQQIRKSGSRDAYEESARERQAAGVLATYGDE